MTDTTPSEALGAAAETENVIETYRITTAWIRFADAKALVVLTINIALAAVLITNLGKFLAKTSPTAPWTFRQNMTVLFFVLWAALAFASGVMVLAGIRARRKSEGDHSALDSCRHFHPLAIADGYEVGQSERFQAEFQALGNEGLRREILAALLIDAHLSARKYERVSDAIRALAFAVIPGFLYLLLAQF